MALFRKIILRPGVYSVKTPNGRKIKPVTKDYLKDLCDTNTKILNEGMNIPSPYAHKDENGISPSIMKDGKDASNGKPINWRSDLNAGFWKAFEIGKNGEFAGYVEIPGDENDPNSPAGKVGKTIVETSVLVEPEWEDGLGRVWKNALRHVALVTNAVEPDQPNFELVDSSPDYALAMSFSMADEIGSSVLPPKQKTQENPNDKSEGSSSETSGKTSEEKNSGEPEEVDPSYEARVSEVISLVREKLGFEMPTDTTCDNFVDRLRTILISFPKEEEEEDLMSLKKPLATKEKPENSEVQQSSPISMSDNPDNLEVIEKKSSKLLEKLLETFKSQLKARIEATIKAGKLGRRYAESNLIPAVDALVMSLEDMDEEGNFPKSEVEIRLEMAEDLSSIFDRTSEMNPGGTAEGLPGDLDGDKKMTQSELDNLYASIGL